MNDLSLYGAIAVSRIALQVCVSMIERRKTYPRIALPPATIVMACYNEPISHLQRALRSLRQQNYPDLEVIVVDDGSKDYRAVKRATEHYGFKYIYQENAGKRAAMCRAFKDMSPKSQIVMTADSDTAWHPNAARELAQVLLSSELIGGVTGEVAVHNANQNLLTKLISIRYHLAFAHERASQSYFGVVTCISGPLGAYRRDVIDRIKHKFIDQKLFGKKCTYGDDRHLTNLVLNEGYDVRYAAKAICWTQAPDKFVQLVKQQTRWSKSYWREIIWQIRVLPKHGFFMVYDWAVSLLLPFILAFTILTHLIQAADGSLWHAWLLLITIVVMSLLRILEPLLRTRRPVFLLFSIYAFIYFAVMLPSKLWALATINDGKWGTR